MDIGLLKEIKTSEHRVMLIPEAIEELASHGNSIYVENGAGKESGFEDKEYESAGAQILPTSEKIFQKVDLILKIQPPMPIEYELFTAKHISFSFLLPQNGPERLHSLVKSSAIYLAADMIDPINKAMGEIAGKVAITQATKYLERNFGGKGVLFSGACGIPGARVSILGCGPAGDSAAQQSLLLGARVNLIDNNYQNLLTFNSKHSSENLNIFEYDRGLLKNILLETDVLIVTDSRYDSNSKMLIKKDDLNLLVKGSLVIDLSINREDRIEASRETKPDNPTYVQDDIVYFSVPNLPSVVPKTSSIALSNIALNYIRQLAQMGFQETIVSSPELRNSLMIYHGKIVNPILAQDSDYQPYDILELLEINI